MKNVQEFPRPGGKQSRVNDHRMACITATETAIQPTFIVKGNIKTNPNFV